MYSKFLVIFIVVAFTTTVSTVNAQNMPTTTATIVAASPASFSSNVFPTTSPQGGGTFAVTYTGSFNLQVTANYDIIMGLASSSKPSISAASISIFRNGVEVDWLRENYFVQTNYSVPSAGAVTAGIPSGQFLIATNNTLTIPVDISLTMALPMDSSFFGIRLNQVSWTSNGLDPSWPIYTESLYGVDWVAGNAPVSAVPEPSTYAVLFGLGALGLVALRRKNSSNLLR